MLLIASCLVQIVRALDEFRGEVDGSNDAGGKASGGNRIHHDFEQDSDPTGYFETFGLLEVRLLQFVPS